MKSRYYILLTSLLLVLGGCKEDNEPAAVLAVTTMNLTSVEYSSFVCGADVVGSGITECGLCWSTTENPTVDDHATNDGHGAGRFTTTVTGLNPGTTYYVRAYAKTKTATIYGNQKHCTTYDKGAATVNFVSFATIKEEAADINCVVLTDGDNAVSERGVCVGESTNLEPTIDNMKFAAGSGVGDFVVTVTGLAETTTYNIRPYAINANGVSYGLVQQLTTATFKVPFASISALTSLTETSFEANVTISTDNRLEITERGFCWANKTNPKITDNKVQMGAGVGSFVASLTALTEGKRYYVKAYAINEKGVGYGNELAFVTPSTRPMVETGAVKPGTVWHHAVTIDGGMITNFGTANAAVTEAGICYGISPDPTIADTKVTQSKVAVGAMDDITLTTLVPSVNYYMRAYAINSYGVAYGESVEFTSLPVYFLPSPVVAPVAPSFNGLRCYLSEVTTPTQGTWQKEQFAAIHAALQANNSRKFDYIRLIINTDNVAGTENYMTLGFYYLNSSNTSYNFQINMKYEIDANGYYSFPTIQIPTSGNYVSLTGNAGCKVEIDKLVGYFSDKKFKIEVEDATTYEAVPIDYWLIPVDNPTQYYKFRIVRYSGVAALPPF